MNDVNVYIRAVDRSHRWRVVWGGALPLHGTHQVSIEANDDLSDILDAQDWPNEAFTAISVVQRDVGREKGLAGEDEWWECTDDPGCKTGEYVRRVPVMRHHAVRGMRSTFTYAEGYGTYTQHLNNPQGEGWQVGSYMREAETRRSVKNPTRSGDFHSIWKAGYQFLRYRLCWYNPGTYDGYSCDKTVEPNGWTSGLYAASTDCCSDAPYYNNDEYGIRLRSGYLKTSGEVEAFQIGFSILGFGLSSKAQWKENTSMRWEPRGDNRRKCLYGEGSFPPQAAIVYAFHDCKPDR